MRQSNLRKAIRNFCVEYPEICSKARWTGCIVALVLSSLWIGYSYSDYENASDYARLESAYRTVIGEKDQRLTVYAELVAALKSAAASNLNAAAASNNAAATSLKAAELSKKPVQVAPSQGVLPAPGVPKPQKQEPAKDDRPYIYRRMEPWGHP